MLYKTLRVLLVMTVFLPLFGMPGQARADCAAPITPGDWHTKPDQPIQYLLDINIPLSSGINFTGQIEITAQANLNVQCDGSVTGTISKIAGAFDYSVAGIPGSCSFTGDYKVKNGKVVIGPGGQPLFKLDQTDVQGTSFKCDNGSFPATTGLYDFELQATKSNANRIEGTKDSGEKDPFYQYIRLLQSKQGGIDWSSGTKLTVGWDLYNDAETPIVTDAQAQYDIYFLQGISASNDLTATVDWKQSKPDKVNFGFQGNTTSIQTGGPTAEWTYNMADLQAGPNPVIITATDSHGLTSPEYLYNFQGVAVPEWAKPAGLSAAPEGSNIIYSGQLKLPKQPFSKMVSLPAFIPVIGGNWGITPVQLTANIRANSSGAPTTGPLKGTGGLALGGDELKLETDGQVTTQLTAETLEFLPDSSYANLNFDPKPYTKQIGIVYLVPGASSLYSIPVIGDMVKALNAIVSVKVSVDPALSGKAFIGIDPADNGLTFTSGQATSDLVLSVLANINVGLASAYASGGGKGSLTINVAAPPSVAACYVKLFFSAGASVAGIFGGGSYGPYNKDWDVAQCGEAALLGGSKSLAVPARAAAPGALRINPRPVGWQPERPALKNTQNNGIIETVLAENANPEAGPVLVANHDGHMALVWMFEDAAKPRQQAMEILVRVSDGKAWSDPIHLTADSRLDTTPAAGFDRDGKLVVTWMMNKAEALGTDTAFDEGLAQHFEIAYAVVDKTGKVETTGQLSDDSTFDFNPQMAAAPDGTLWAIWQSSPGTKMIGTFGSPNQLLAARWDGKAWSAVETVTDALTGTLFWKAAANGANDLRVAADLDTDGDLTTANDREIVLFTRAGQGWSHTQVTKNNIPDTAPLLTFASGKPVLAWLSGKQVVGISGDPSQAPQVWLEESAGVSAALGNGNLLGGPGGSLVLAWCDTSPLGADIWLSQRGIDGKWNMPTAQFSTPDQRKALTAALAPNGDLLLGMARVKVAPSEVTLSDGSSISIPSAGPNADLVMARISSVIKTPGGFDPQAWGPYIVGAILCLLCLGTLALSGYTFWYLRSRRTA